MTSSIALSSELNRAARVRLTDFILDSDVRFGNLINIFDDTNIIADRSESY